MNMLKRSLAMLLVLAMLFSVVPFSVFAEETVETTAATEAMEAESGAPGNSNFGHSQGKGKDKDKHKNPQDQTEATEVTEETVPETTVETVPETTEETVPEVTVPQQLMMAAAPAAETETNVASTDGVYTDPVDAPDEFIRVFHLDVGRRYFDVDEVKTIIDALAANYYTHMELALGNDGLRFLLDDMSVGTYDSATVTAGVKAGNIAYAHAGEWSQAEMDDVIVYANSKGIEIIPLINTPGHMDTILDAMESCGISGSYNGSARTVDITNADAVAFTQELVGKYMDYFASKGCTYFNIGADEYANDKYTTGSMGWGHLMTANLYDEFIEYVNQLVAMAADKGLRPIAFNDGIYFEENTSFGTFDTRLIVAAWTGGWGGFDVARTSFLAGKNHLILNTNERWYYVVGRSTGGYGYSNALDYATSEKVTVVTDHESGVASMGAMQCVWYDTPSVSYTDSEVTRIKTLIQTLAANNTDYFKAPEVTEPTPVVDETTKVSVTAQNVTKIEVAVTENVPTVEGASAVVAFDMTPKTEDGTAYTGEATVSIPVSAEWTNVRGGVLASDHGKEVMGIQGELKDGFFTFTVPHFSTVVAYEVAPTAEGVTETITLEVGGTHTVTVAGTDLSGTYTPNPEGIADVTVKYEQVPGETTVTLGDQITPDSTYGWSDTGLIKSGDYYMVMGSDGKLSATKDAAEATIFTVKRSSNSRWTIQSGSNYLAYNNGLTVTTTEYEWRYSGGFYYRSSNYDYYYITCSNGSWTTAVNSSVKTLMYDFTSTTGTPVNQSTITFEGLTPGSASVEIGGTTYNITVNKKNVNATVYVGMTGQFADYSTTVTVEDDSVATATLSKGVLTINGISVGTTTVTTDNAVYTIKVSEFDASTVTPLTVEYWITNIVTRTVESTTTNPVTTQQISASIEGIPTVNGVDINAMMPATTIKRDGDSGADRQVEFWHVRLLDKTQANNSSSGTEEQTTDSADDETTNGDAVTRVRYYDPGDGKGARWQLLSGSAWLDVTANSQIVAYYMEAVDIQNANGTTELHVNAADWGKLGDNSPASSYADTSKYCSISLQIVYEDGSGNPATTTAADLDSKTLIFNYWDNGRGIGTFAFDTLGQFNIYQITAETGAVDVTFTGGAWGTAQVTEFEWDNNEKVVWSGESETASIFNNTSHPSSADPLDNLMWNENKEAILIRVYVHAVETEDSLTVVYIDEKFDDTLYSYNIQVPAEKNFNNAMIGTPANMNDGRINVTGCGIENVYGQTQYFQTDLTLVPEAKGKYNSELYEYKGSEISADGKTLYLYYNIDTTVLSPNFVVDFGLPITFPLTDLLGEGTEANDVTNVSGLSARYGTLTYSNGTFTYTPNKILQNIDVLSITLTIDGEAATTNVGVTPATTVYYEESFLTYDSNWRVGTAPTKTQATEVLGDSSYYGYDPAYAQNEDKAGSNGTQAVSRINGATASFTFTGTGFELYANSKPASGIVTVYSQGTVSKLYMIDTELNSENSAGAENAEDFVSAGTHYGLPIISETSLPHGTYTVQLKQTNGDEVIYIDGVRVINTLHPDTTIVVKKDGQDVTQNIYLADEEDYPAFYELRDYVLNALTITDTTSEDYGNLEQMKNQVYAGISSNGEAPAAAAVLLSNNTKITDVQDLLDNGPKNELYLYPGTSLTFSFQTDRVAQLGLKSPTGSVNYTLNGVAKTLNTTVDMFYKIAEKDAASGGMTVTIAVPSDATGVLSVTDLKICDDPNASFLPLTLTDIENTLVNVYGFSNEQPPVKPSEPEIPTEPSKPTEPEIPSEPIKPTEPEETKPSKPTEPEEPTKPSKPEKQKDAKLKITYVNIFGRKVGTTTLVKTGTANQRCVFTASEIAEQAPANRTAMWLLPVVSTYGRNISIIVPVI